MFLKACISLMLASAEWKRSLTQTVHKCTSCKLCVSPGSCVVFVFIVSAGDSFRCLITLLLYTLQYDVFEVLSSQIPSFCLLWCAEVQPSY